MLAESFGVDWLRISLPFDCEIHWCRPMRLETNDNYKVLLIHTEPSQFSVSFDELAKINGFFDLIIAKDPKFLALDNVVLAPFGGCWVSKLPGKKEFSTSFILSVGNHQGLSGYAERFGFIREIDKIHNKLVVYKSKRLADVVEYPFPLLENDSRNCLFDSMFHVSIENCCEVNYFTEKLIDCFATYTVPIYIGCPNVADYFNMDGMIIAANHGELPAIINRLSPQDYWGRIGAMRDNFVRSRKYIDFVARVRNLIVKHGAPGRSPFGN